VVLAVSSILHILYIAIFMTERTARISPTTQVFNNSDRNHTYTIKLKSSCHQQCCGTGTGTFNVCGSGTGSGIGFGFGYHIKWNTKVKNQK
jgi:hypothetical protein